MTSATGPIEPWARPAFRPTDRSAAAMLIAFAADDVLGTAPDLELRGAVPANAPADEVDLRVHHYAKSAEWIDGMRQGALRNIAERDLDDLARLDAATCCYTIAVEVDDPADLTHLQMAWAVASALARLGLVAVLDAYAISWLSGAAVAALDPRRPFSVEREVSLIAENSAVPGFGHPVHTRGMVKFGRPDLIAGVPAADVQHTAKVINHLAGMLADGHVFTPGQQFRFDGEQTYRVEPYVPGGTVPDVNLNNDGLRLMVQ